MSDKKHFKYSPSASKRQIECPGSMALSADLPDRGSSYASEGTDAHDAAELAVMGMYHMKTYEEFESERFTDEMREHARAFANFIASRMAEYDERPRVSTERALVSERFPEYGGTTDVLIKGVRDGRFSVEIVDFKYGAGVQVQAENNTQLLDYLNIATESFRKSMDPQTWPNMAVHVFQPRSGDGLPSSWDVIAQDLWGHDDVRAKGIATEEGKLPGHDALKPGDHCQFCKAKTICPELHSRQGELAQIEFDVTTPATSVNALAESLGDGWAEKAAMILGQADHVEGLIKAVRSRALEDAKRGVHIPGFKVVNKHGHRKWNDEETALKRLATRKDPRTGKGIGKRGATIPKLKSPAQIEKEFGKAAAAGLFHKPEGGVKLVPETAKGDALNFDTPATTFDDLSFLQ